MLLVQTGKQQTLGPVLSALTSAAILSKLAAALQENQINVTSAFTIPASSYLYASGFTGFPPWTTPENAAWGA